MNVTNLPNTPAKLIVEDNVLAVVSDNGLTTVSSAIYNGGFKKVKAILNIQVPEGYSDVNLHEDPLRLVKLSSEKIGVQESYLAMITAAKITNRHQVTKSNGTVTVNVVATAGASHGESAGEKIDADHVDGTINIIVVINGNPTDSCLVAAFVTATEAKTAALNDLDIRSRYSGQAATGTITDSLSVATTNTGPMIELGGPASHLGQLVASCVREAVKEAIKKQDGTQPARSVASRLKARHLPVEKLASELSKIKSLKTDQTTLAAKLNTVLHDPLYASFVFAAAYLDDNVKKGTVPSEFGDVTEASRKFGNLITEGKDPSTQSELQEVDLPPFTKQALFSILRKEQP
jgi:iron complex transport system ATP-binding protein